MSFFNRKPTIPTSEPDILPEPIPSALEPVAPTPERAITPPNRTFDTVLGAGAILIGDLSSDGNVRLDGTFKGTLKISENVLVGMTAQVDADLSAKTISIAGSVRGDVVGNKVHLLSTAKVWGNITAKSLVTEDGAFIEGKVSMGETSIKAATLLPDKEKVEHSEGSQTP
ncbi:MAG: bactofilin family protein [Phototrophicaceae bacterium]|jgi:cytoskeletal protein CcmA (bactofilin family)